MSIIEPQSLNALHGYRPKRYVPTNLSNSWSILAIKSRDYINSLQSEWVSWKLPVKQLAGNIICQLIFQPVARLSTILCIIVQQYIAGYDSACICLKRIDGDGDRWSNCRFVAVQSSPGNLQRIYRMLLVVKVVRCTLRQNGWKLLKINEKLSNSQCDLT